jgi:hypothetical protein
VAGSDVSVPVPDKRNSADSLENFAQRIEARLRLGKDKQPFAMERLICRLLSSKKTPHVSAIMAQKWVEWRYGKAKETLKVEGHIEHTVFDASRLSDDQLAEAERLVESASVGSDQG